MPFSGSSSAGHWVRTTRWRSASGTLWVMPAAATTAVPPCCEAAAAASSPAAVAAAPAAAAALRTAPQRRGAAVENWQRGPVRDATRGSRARRTNMARILREGPAFLRSYVLPVSACPGHRQPPAQGAARCCGWPQWQCSARAARLGARRALCPVPCMQPRYHKKYRPEYGFDAALYCHMISAASDCW
eukprot:COSAG06_NODE_955_length_11326_cov_6.392358_10_plen_188_part_00